MDEEYLSVKEVAAMLHVSSVVVRKLIKRGELKGKRVVKEYRIAKSDLEKYMGATK